MESKPCLARASVLVLLQTKQARAGHSWSMTTAGLLRHRRWRPWSGGRAQSPAIENSFKERRKRLRAPSPATPRTLPDNAGVASDSTGRAWPVPQTAGWGLCRRRSEDPAAEPPSHARKGGSDFGGTPSGEEVMALAFESKHPV